MIQPQLSLYHNLLSTSEKIRLPDEMHKQFLMRFNELRTSCRNQLSPLSLSNRQETLFFIFQQKLANCYLFYKMSLPESISFELVFQRSFLCILLIIISSESFFFLFQYLKTSVRYFASHSLQRSHLVKKIANGS